MASPKLTWSRSTTFAISACVSCSVLFGQVAPPMVWQGTFGGSQDEVGHQLIHTSDQGFVVAGFTTSVDGDVSGQNGDHDMWIFKINSIGALVWQRTLGGVSWDDAHGLAQAADDGFFLAGVTTPYPILYSQAAAAKLDSAGNVEWSVTLGGSSNETIRDVAATSDGGCILAGSAESNDGDVSGNHGLMDAWVVKLDAAGSLSWQHCFGGSAADVGWSIIQTQDGGYLLAGSTLSTDGDVTVNQGFNDVWLVKLDSAGTIQWQRTFGGSGSESPRDLLATSDGGCIVAAETRSSDGDVIGQHGDQDMWIVKLDALGEMQWQRCLGGSALDIPIDIDQLNDDGYILSGNTRSDDGDVSGNHGFMDAWVARLDGAGSLLWQKTMGGSDFDGGHAVEALPDGHFMIAGYAQSNDGDVQNFIGVRDVWVIELGEEDLATALSRVSPIPELLVIPNPTNGLVRFVGDINAMTSYEVIDATGKVLLTGRFDGSDRTLDLSTFPPGPYMLKGTQVHGAFCLRVVME